MNTLKLSWFYRFVSRAELYVQPMLACLLDSARMLLPRKPATSTEGPRVDFVHWRDVSLMTGRPVFIDSLHRVAYTMPSVVPVQNYHTNNGCIVVHPSLGVQMLKVRGHLRPEMPEEFRVLKQMWESALIADTLDHTLAPSTSFDACYCMAGEPSPTCCVCLLSWHDACVQKVMSVPQVDGRLVSESDPTRRRELRGPLASAAPGPAP